MQNKTSIITTLFSLLMIVLIPVEGSQPKFQELELKYFFPDEKQVADDIFLYRANRISTDNDGNIYVVSQGDKQVLVFSLEGQFIRRIGREGQGPGEFQGPNHAVPWNNKLFVLDNLVKKIQIFDLNGDFRNGFLLPNVGSWDMAFSKNGNIFLSPFLRPINENSKLVTVLSDKGELLHTYGLPIKLARSHTVHNRVRLAIHKNNELAVAFQSWPIIRKYSQKGELLGEYNIEHKEMKEYAEFNRRGQKSQGGATMIRETISDIHIFENAIYLLFDSFENNYIEIIELDDRMSIRNTYHYDYGGKTTVQDFFMNRLGKNMVFYVLQRTPKNRIDVFEVKK